MFIVWFCTEINIVILILLTKSRVVSLFCVSAARDQWRVPGVGNCLFLRARGWGIDRPLRKNGKSPGGMPGVGWYYKQVELNHTLIWMKGRLFMNMMSLKGRTYKFNLSFIYPCLLIFDRFEPDISRSDLSHTLLVLNFAGTKFCLHPKVQGLTLSYTIFDRIGTLSYTFNQKW